jgi:hypothetical protein
MLSKSFTRQVSGWTGTRTRPPGENDEGLTPHAGRESCLCRIISACRHLENHHAHDSRCVL